MSKTIEEMTIAELRAAIVMKQRLARQAPKLRKERDRILARLREIEDLLGVAGPARRGRKQVAKGKTVVEKTATPVATGKRQQGVKAAILAAIGSKPVGAKAIAQALEKKGFVVNRKTLPVTLSKMVRKGEIGRAGRGLYCGAKKTAIATTQKPAEKPLISGRTIKQRLLEFLGKTKDLHKTAEIRKALPDVKPGYIYNLLGELRRNDVVVHENGMWGLKLPF